MNTTEVVAVCSRSFSGNTQLRNLLACHFKSIKFNDNGAMLYGNALVDFLKDATMAIIGLEKIDDALLLETPLLRVISKYGVGLDSIDLTALSNHGILMGWSPGVNKTAVAELVISYSIFMLRGVLKSNRELINGIWSQTPGQQLSNKTFGVIGCGNVGKEVIRLLRPFNNNIIFNDVKRIEEFKDGVNAKQVSLNELLQSSDVISIHTPLNELTKNLISKKEFELMKPSTVLLNLARGGIVDEYALEEVLVNKKIYAAASDVFSLEPPFNSGLLKLDNFLGSPHIGGSSKEAILNMGLAAINGLLNPLAPSSFQQYKF